MNQSHKVIVVVDKKNLNILFIFFAATAMFV